MASSLSVNITADVADLRAKLALAQADLRAFSAETKSLATEMRAAGDGGGGALGAGLQAAAQSAAQAKAQVAALNAEIKAAGSQPATAFGAMKAELQAVGGAVTGAIGGFKELAGVIAVGFGVEKIVGLATAAAKLGHDIVDTAEVTGIGVEKLTALKFAADITGTSFDNFTRLMVKFESNLQASLQHPTDDAARALRALGISQDFVREHSNDLGLMLETVAQKLFQFAAGGNRAEIEAKILGQRMGPELTPVLEKLANEGFGGLAEQARKAGIALDDKQAKDLAGAYERLNTATEGLGFTIGKAFVPFLTEAATDTRDLINWLDRLDEASHAWVDRTFPLLARRQAQAAGTVTLQPLPGGGIGGPMPAASAAAGPEETKPQAPSIAAPPDTGASALEKFRETLAEMQADWTGTRREMLEVSAEMWREEAQNANLTEKQKVEAAKSAADARRELNKFAAQEDQTIARQDADTDVAIGKLTIEAKKQQLNEELAAHRITAEEKLAILRDLTNQEYALDLKRLEDELSTLTQEPIAYDRVYNQIRTLKAKLNQDLTALNRQAAADATKAANEEAQAWKSAFQEITSASTSALHDLLAGRLSFAQAAIQVSARLVESEIANDAKYVLARLFYSQAELAADRSIAQGGLLIHMLGEQQKNAATASGVATRRTIESTEDTSLVSRLGSTLARWLGFETSKTAATAAGAAQRTATETASAATSTASQIALAFSEIQIAASVSAAEAFADTAAAGPAGLIAAPEAAAAAYATVMGFASGLGAAALETGAWEIPGVMPAILHPKESVLSAGPAEAMRNFFESGAATRGAGGGGGALSQVVNVAVNGAKMTGREIAKLIAQEVRNANSNLSALAGA